MDNEPKEAARMSQEARDMFFDFIAEDFDTAILLAFRASDGMETMVRHTKGDFYRLIGMLSAHRDALLAEIQPDLMGGEERP